MAFGINIKGSGGSSGASTITTVIGKITKKIEADIDAMGKQIRSDLSDSTPYRTGQTARAWKYRDKARGFQVANNKNWIGSLNEGRHSSKSKNNGPDPSKGWVQQTVRNNIKK